MLSTPHNIYFLNLVLSRISYLIEWHQYTWSYINQKYKNFQVSLFHKIHIQPVTNTAISLLIISKIHPFFSFHFHFHQSPNHSSILFLPLYTLAMQAFLKCLAMVTWFLCTLFYAYVQKVKTIVPLPPWTQIASTVSRSCSRSQLKQHLIRENVPEPPVLVRFLC